MFNVFVMVASYICIVESFQNIVRHWLEWFENFLNFSGYPPYFPISKFNFWNILKILPQALNMKIGFHVSNLSIGIVGFFRSLETFFYGLKNLITYLPYSVKLKKMKTSLRTTSHQDIVTKFIFVKNKNILCET